MPELFIITGSNGAGKSTIGPEYLPFSIRSKCLLFDGDKLFMQLKNEFWNNGLKAPKEVRKLAIDEVRRRFELLVEESIQKSTDFVYEGHFTNDETWSVPLRFKQEGYNIHLIFLGLENIEISELRVIQRVKEGGHYVDPQTINANYFGNPVKLNQYYKIFDSVRIIDTSSLVHKPICTIELGKVTYGMNKFDLPLWFTELLPTIASMM